MSSIITPHTRQSLSPALWAQQSQNAPRLTIGVAGGTCSGKTTMIRAIMDRVGCNRILCLEYDAYYKDLSGLSPSERTQVNFDHPDALETEMLVAHIRQLQAGLPIGVPIYDFPTHTRLPLTRLVFPKPVIIVEGSLTLADTDLRDLFDIKIFVDTDADIRSSRRIKRDIAERGRTMESVIEQYLKTVCPMHWRFVEPSKHYADLIIPWEDHNDVAVDLVAIKILDVLVQERREIDGQAQYLVIRDREYV